MMLFTIESHSYKSCLTNVTTVSVTMTWIRFRSYRMTVMTT